MKTMTVWRDGNNFGLEFKDGNKVIGWENLSKQEKAVFVHALFEFAEFFEHFLLQEEENEIPHLRHKGLC